MIGFFYTQMMDPFHHLDMLPQPVTSAVQIGPHMHSFREAPPTSLSHGMPPHLDLAQHDVIFYNLYADLPDILRYGDPGASRILSVAIAHSDHDDRVGLHPADPQKEFLMI